MSVGRVSIAAEIDGKVYFVVLPQERMKILLKLAEGLCDGGKLPVKKAPDDYKFQEVK